MEIQDKYDALSNEVTAKLCVAVEEKEVDPKPRMQEYLDHYQQFLQRVVPMLSGSQGGKVDLTVPQNFNLQTLFDKWFDREKSDGAFLFKDHDYIQKLLGHWNVEYEGKLKSFLLVLAILSR